ncbi:MAG TPA: hypothetical protein VN612_10555 [Acidobacteriaceae bacterium]|nr:hypothetical protein [Acidobacteriaceae bacterium]
MAQHETLTPVYGPAALEMERVETWRTGEPPEPGFYLVTVEVDIFDDGNVSRSVRMERWDGERFPLMGGYATFVAWMPLPRPFSF